MLEYWNGGMMGKDCSTCWRAGVLACTRTGEDARTPILKHPIIPTFQHSIIPFQSYSSVYSRPAAAGPGGGLTYGMLFKKGWQL
jgi:hypothetical protein